MDLGTLVDQDGRTAVRFERTYPHPVQRVWAAVTDPAELGHWFPAAVTLEQRVGGTVTFSFDPHSDDSTGAVLAIDPPRHLSFTWEGDELHFDLAPTGDGGCRLTLTNVLDGRDAAARNAAGWSVCLVELDRHLAGERAEGPHSATAAPWQAFYDEHVAAGLPSGAPIPTSSP